MGGMLTNNTLREILSNVIYDFTYSTNERESEREGEGDRQRTVCKKVDVFGRKILELEF